MSECLYFWQTLAHMTLNKHDDNDHDALYIIISDTRHGNAGMQQPIKLLMSTKKTVIVFYYSHLFCSKQDFMQEVSESSGVIVIMWGLVNNSQAQPKLQYKLEELA